MARLSLFVFALLNAFFVLLAQGRALEARSTSCTWTALATNPLNYQCDATGSVKNPVLLSTFQSTTSSWTGCRSACHTNTACISYSYNSATNVCKEYGATVISMGLTKSSTSDITFWNRHCYTETCSSSTTSRATSSSSTHVSVITSVYTKVVTMMMPTTTTMMMTTTTTMMMPTTTTMMMPITTTVIQEDKVTTVKTMLVPTTVINYKTAVLPTTLTSMATTTLTSMATSNQTSVVTSDILTTKSFTDILSDTVTATVTSDTPTTIVSNQWTTMVVTMNNTVTDVLSATVTATQQTTMSVVMNNTITAISSATVTTTATTSVALTSASAVPICGNQGLEFAYISTGDGTDTAASNTDGAVLLYYTYPQQFKTGYKPAIDGFTTYVGGINLATDDSSFDVYNSGSFQSTGYFALNHRGYLYAAITGTYTVEIPTPDDVVYVWAGSNAYSGYTGANVLVANGWDINGVNSDAAVTVTGTVYLTAGTYMPLRIFFGQGAGGAYFYMSITAPDGGSVLSASGTNDTYIVQYSCDGTTAPAYPAWGSET